MDLDDDELRATRLLNGVEIEVEQNTEEDIKILEEFRKSIKNFNNYADNTNVSLITKKELLNYLEEISQQLNNIALDQIPFAISELYFKLENSIPISLIEKKIEELENSEPSDDDYNFEVQNDIHSKIDILQELLEENKNE